MVNCLSTYLHPQHRADHPALDGWTFDTIPPTFDAIALGHKPLTSRRVRDICARLNGTMTVTIPMWMQRGQWGSELSVMLTPKVGPIIPYEIPPNGVQSPSTLCLTGTVSRDLHDGDGVQMTWWPDINQSHIHECDVVIVRGPEAGFPEALWEFPALFDNFIRHPESESSVTGYFPPLSDADQVRLANTLHQQPKLRNLHAGWMRAGGQALLLSWRL